MAETYSYIPKSVPTFFREIVRIVSDNLKYTISDELAGMPIYFKHGSWMEIEKQLMEDTQGRVTRNQKYPLVILIHPVNEKMNKERNASSINCDVLIVTDSEINKSVDDREADNFIPILYPIYSELLQQIQDSTLYMNYSTLNHTKKDLYHLGQESTNGNIKYKLPDALDGVALLGLEFDLKLLELGTDDICNDTECPLGREVDIMSYISSVFVRVVGKTLSIYFESAYHYASDGSNATYTIEDIVTAETQPINVGQTIHFDLSLRDDGGNAFRISCLDGDVYVDISYLISEHQIVSYSTGIVQTITPYYDFELYPNYTARFDYNHELYGATFLSYALENNGSTIVDESVTMGSNSIHVIQDTSISNTQSNIYLYVDNTGSPFETKSIIKLKCKS